MRITIKILGFLGLLFFSLFIGAKLSVPFGTGFFLVIILLIVLLPSAIIQGIFDYRNRTKKSISFFIISFFLAVILLFGPMTKEVIDETKEMYATSLVAKIQEHYDCNGCYPADIKDITPLLLILDVNYSTDSVRQTYRIEYSIDSWYTNWYNQNEKKWERYD